MTNLSQITPATTKPTFTPSPQEYQDGYFREGIFYCPQYAIARNGEILEPLGIEFAYPHKQAYHTLIHLQAVSDDKFSLEVVSYKAMTDYNVILDSDTQGGEHG